MEAAALLCADVRCILDSDLVALGYAVCPLECKGAYGTTIWPPTEPASREVGDAL